MKWKIGREPLGLRRIDPPMRVANHERRGGRLVFLVAHAERDGASGQAGEQRVHFVAVTDVLRALADIEGELCFAPTGVATVELKDAVFERQTAEGSFQRLLVI